MEGEAQMTHNKANQQGRFAGLQVYWLQMALVGTNLTSWQQAQKPVSDP